MGDTHIIYTLSAPVLLISLTCVAFSRQPDPTGDMGQVIALTKLARMKRESGKFAEAESDSRRALDLITKVSGRESTTYAIASGNLADDLIAEGRSTEAARLLNAALAAYEFKAGTRTKAYADLLAVQGELLLAEDRTGPAIKTLKQELQIRRDLRSGARDMAVLYQNFAVLYDRAGKPKQALASIEKAQRTWTDALSDDDPEKVSCAATLLVIYTRTRHYAEANRLVPYLVAHAEPAFGAGNPQLAVILTNIGVLYQEQKRYRPDFPASAFKMDTSKPPASGEQPSH